MNAGASLTFSATAESSTPATFQWRKNGQDIQGALGNSLRLANISLADAGVYTALASNAAGSTTSNSMAIVVLDGNAVASLPIISSQPLDVKSLLFGSATLQVTATGSPAPSYQWLKNGVPIPNATSATLSLTGLISSDSYSVVVSNSAGSVVSRSASLLVWGGGAGGTPVVDTAIMPVITSEPTDTKANVGGSAYFSVTASGTPAPTFMWRKDGVPIPGATQSSLSLSGVTSSASYSVVVSNPAGSVLSRAAVLSVSSSPVFTSQPSSQAVVTGNSVVFSAAASGSPAPWFQWRRNGANLSGATSTTLSLNSVTKADEGTYDVVAWNNAGNAVSNGASLVVQAPYVPPPAQPWSPPPPPPPAVAQRLSSTLSLSAGGKQSIGFQISGDTPKTILIRVLGPTLAALGTPGALADPMFFVSGSAGIVAKNNDWGGSPEIMQATSQAGATPFVSGDSKDAAMLVTVAPGAYSLILTAIDGGGGTALVEVYEFP